MALPNLSVYLCVIYNAYKLIICYTLNILIVSIRLGLAMISPYTKYEVSMFAHYDDMKGNTKYRNWSGLGWLGVTQSHRHHT